MIKKLVMISTAVLTTFLALAVLWQLRIVVVYVLISLALAATIRPLIKHLEGKKALIRVFWIILYLVILGGMSTLIFFTSRLAIIEVNNLGQNLSVQDTWILPSWLEGSKFQQFLTQWLPPPSKLFEAITGDEGQLILPAILGFVQNTGSVVTGFVIILFLSIYWSINQVHFERLWLSLLPSDQRKQARGIWRVVEPEIGAYIRGMVIHSLILGLVLGLGFLALGSPHPALLALVGAFASLIPLVGGVFLIVLIFLVGLLTSVPLSLLTALFAVIVLIALGVWVKPRVYNGKRENHILTLVLLIALGDVFGIIGLIIAPLISLVCQILWRRLVSHRRVTGAAEQISDLKERREKIWEKIIAISDPPLPLMASSLERLDELIAQSEPFLRANNPNDTSKS